MPSADNAREMLRALQSGDDGEADLVEIASSDAMRASHARAISGQPPRQKPRIAASVSFVHEAMTSVQMGGRRWARTRGEGLRDLELADIRAAQNARSLAPRRTIAASRTPPSRPGPGSRAEEA